MSSRIPVICLILAMMVFATACVNNLAVKELNNKAKIYMEQGNTEAAISRLEAGIDLDDGFYETYYNLAIACLKAEQNDKAVKALDNVLKLNPDFADAYYSLGVAYSQKASELIDKYTEELNEENPENENNDADKETELSGEQKSEIIENLTKSVDNYTKYISKKEDITDKDAVLKEIDYLNLQIAKYNFDPETVEVNVDKP